MTSTPASGAPHSCSAHASAAHTSRTAAMGAAPIAPAGAAAGRPVGWLPDHREGQFPARRKARADRIMRRLPFPVLRSAEPNPHDSQVGTNALCGPQSVVQFRRFRSAVGSPAGRAAAAGRPVGPGLARRFRPRLIRRAVWSRPAGDMPFDLLDHAGDAGRNGFDFMPAAAGIRRKASHSGPASVSPNGGAEHHETIRPRRAATGDRR